MHEVVMTEGRFSTQVFQRLKKGIKSYGICQENPLLYKLSIGADGKPISGRYVFKTDILIRDDKVPLVAIELKYGNITTHDILAYSAKARKHKVIYPYLRYGLVIGGREKVDRRFFVHNTGFDFAVAIENFRRESPKLLKVVKHQLSIAEQVIKMLEGREINSYEISESFN